MSKYHIIYPCGDRSRLSVVEIVDALSYELNDYAVASRKSFDDESDANVYCRQLAKDNGLVCDLSNSDYLD